MVWEDKLMSASGKEAMAPAARTQRSGSSGSGHGGYRAGHVQPALDPPSPRVAACGFCSIFGKDNKEAPRPQRRAGGGAAKGKRR
jgi:hypothetical protein